MLISDTVCFLSYFPNTVYFYSKSQAYCTCVYKSKVQNLFKYNRQIFFVSRFLKSLSRNIFEGLNASLSQKIGNIALWLGKQLLIFLNNIIVSLHIVHVQISVYWCLSRWKRHEPEMNFASAKTQITNITSLKFLMWRLCCCFSFKSQEGLFHSTADNPFGPLSWKWMLLNCIWADTRCRYYRCTAASVG